VITAVIGPRVLSAGNMPRTYLLLISCKALLGTPLYVHSG